MNRHTSLRHPRVLLGAALALGLAAPPGTPAATADTEAIMQEIAAMKARIKELEAKLQTSQKAQAEAAEARQEA